MQVSQDIIKKEFEILLKQFGIEGTAIVGEDNNVGSFVEILQNEKGIFLKYHPGFLVNLDSLSDLQVSLKHEICHLLTIPTHKVPIPHVDAAVVAAYIEYIDIFREYLAENEYNKRLPNDKQFYLKRKKKIFMPEKTLSDLRNEMQNWTDPRRFFFVRFGAIFRIFYDSVYFYIVGDDTFRKWCKSKNTQSWYQFFEWVIEDMRFIEKKEIGYFDKLNLVSDSFNMAISIDLRNLLQKNILSIIRHPDEIQGLHPDIGSLWKSRQIKLSQ